MTTSRSSFALRGQRILDAAAELIVHYGYDKSSVSDIARHAGVSKGAIYLHYAGKDELFEALLAREMNCYAEAWLATLEADPAGSTLGALYRAILYAVHSSPLMLAIFKQDQRVLGSYLHQPGNFFITTQTHLLRTEFIQAMQAAGVVRRELDPAVITHIMEIISFGMVSISNRKDPAAIPPLAPVIETIAEMMERAFTPVDADLEAGKAVIHQMVTTARNLLATKAAGNAALAAENRAE
jgi:AcrR family transcriptional regulator